jgi:vacuolar-type H+-ATPase subunit D/Vma8
MYKILIKNKNKVIKKKFYETVDEFNKWYEDHNKRYKRVYQVKGYELIGLNPDKWEEV